MIHGAVQLDPYNMDAYYFAQAILVWDVGKVSIADDLLDYGMRFRNWDWYLPFFAGFNHAFFLKDYNAAAKYYQRAGELSGSNLFKSLAGRYMQKAGQTDMAILFLSAMANGEKNPAIRQSYQTRIAAFREVRRIEIARDKFRETTGRLPDTIDVIIRDGYLSPLPADPYGGKFFLEPNGKVATTSKFAYAPRNTVSKNNNDQEKH
jgi:tetratricopeptide (TPR) repeat protein